MKGEVGKGDFTSSPFSPLAWRSVHRCEGVSVILGESAQGSSFKLGEQSRAV